MRARGNVYGNHAAQTQESLHQKVRGYDQEIPQSHTADQPMAVNKSEA